MPDNTSTPQNMKKFKRISRADSMMGIAKFTKESPGTLHRQSAILQPTNTNETNNTTTKSILIQNETRSTIEMDSLRWNSTDDQTAEERRLEINNVQTTTDAIGVINNDPISTINDNINDGNNLIVNNDDDDDNNLTSSPPLYFPDEQAVLNYVLEKNSIETIFEKYLNKNSDKLSNIVDDNENNQTTSSLSSSTTTFSSSQIKSLRTIMKLISNKMLTNTKLKSNILEILSESHPIEFLEHAIQENLNSTVCDKLNSNSIIEYICEKSKLNSIVRKSLLERVQNLLKLDKIHNDYYEFITQLISNHKLTNDEILNCIQILVNQKNNENKNSGNIIIEEQH